MGDMPTWFGCRQCRKEWDRNFRRGEASLNKGGIDRCTPTRRTKPNNAPLRARRASGTSYEYRCLDCGHVGWTTHLAFANRCDSLGVRPHASDDVGILRFQLAQLAQAGNKA